MNTSSRSASIIASIAYALLFLSTIANAVDGNQIHVKIIPGADPSYLETMGTVAPLFTLPSKQLKKMSRAKAGLPDLTLWYSVTSDGIMAYLTPEGNLLEGEGALGGGIITDVVIPKVVPPPQASAATTPDFISKQDYLRSNKAGNNGIDAEYSWTFSGGDGAGVTIYDVEYAWNQAHEDLASVDNVKLLLNDIDSSANPFVDATRRANAVSHGTAVLGEMIGTADNGVGVKGISHGANVGMAPEYTTLLGSARANAILLAVNDGKPGDVILLEMQAPACGLADGNYGPAEDDLSVFEATKIAVGNGFVVVAAAGNGNVNLDGQACGDKYNRAVRDSGAIMVGAGGSGTAGCSPARQKLEFSTHGTRLDVHGWGECIWSTAYGEAHKDPNDKIDENKWYTDSFGGTSGAGPFVAAAAANLQGIAMKEFGGPRDPLVIRKLLTDTGLPQLGDDTDKRIGPLVNLRAAIDTLLAMGETTFKPYEAPRRGGANGYGDYRSKMSRSSRSSSSWTSGSSSSESMYSSWSKSGKSGGSSKSGKSRSKSSKSGGSSRCITKERKKCIKSKDCEWSGNICVNDDSNFCVGKSEIKCKADNDCDWNGNVCVRDKDSDDCDDLNKKMCLKTNKCSWDGDDCASKNNNNNNKSICKKNNRKKDCQKAKTCDWDGKVCNNDKNNRVSSINEKVGADGFIMTQLNQPTSGGVVTKISTIFGCAFMATWYQWN